MIPVALEPPRLSAVARTWRPRQIVGPYTQHETSHRVVNVTIAIVGLLLALPVMLVIALAIKLTSSGPVFFTQTRVGVNRRRIRSPDARYRADDRGGKPFTMLKFRTMVHRHGPAAGAEVWATPDDPRVTRLGRMLRLYRLDELPQLINVLLGDMNVVGPRPEQPTIFARLRDEIHLYQARQAVPPGITGWAQINQHYDSSIEDVKTKLRFDLEYIGRRTVLEDLRIMLLTLPAMLGKFGAW